jgi:hypothetical protein
MNALPSVFPSDHELGSIQEGWSGWHKRNRGRNAPARMNFRVFEDLGKASHECPVFHSLQAFENAESLVLDKRTVMRVIDRGVAMGKLQHYSMHVPTSRTGKDPTTIPVILGPGVKLEGNLALIRKVRPDLRKADPDFKNATRASPPVAFLFSKCPSKPLNSKL